MDFVKGVLDCEEGVKDRGRKKRIVRKESRTVRNEFENGKKESRTVRTESRTGRM